MLRINTPKSQLGATTLVVQGVGFKVKKYG